MTLNQKYANSVDTGTYPSDVTVPLDDSFVDQRGEILNILLSPITSIARITSKKGSVRANHFHKTDWHYAFVESGKVLYFEREIGAQSVPEPLVFVPGQMFFTKPNIEHAMLFVEDSTIYTFAKNIRSHDNHESDLIRVSFITQDIINQYVS